MPKVNPEILSWARENMGLSPDEAARKLSIKDGERLLAYETGEKEPSRSLLLKMEKLYRKPLLTFYLSRQPRQGDRGQDFRTLPGGEVPADDAFVDVLIRDVKARQSLLKETLIEEDEAQELEFIGRVRDSQSITDVAATICETIQFDLETFRDTRTVDDAFKYLRTLVENKGVFVLLAGNLGSHHTNISTATFRGFVLSDPVAPFIIINDQDSRPAWCFSLLHELVHLFLGQTGLSGSDGETSIERFCNDVASEMLLPARELSNIEWEPEFDVLASQISEFAFERKISGKLVSYRLFRARTIRRDVWSELNSYFYDQWLATRERGRRQDTAVNYYVVRRHRLGNSLVQVAERMMRSGALTMTETGLLLGMKPLKVHRLFEAAQSA